MESDVRPGHVTYCGEWNMGKNDGCHFWIKEEEEEV